MQVTKSTRDKRDYALSQFLPQGISIDLDEYILPLPDKSIVLNQYTTPTCVGQACAMAKMITEYMMTNKWIGLSPYSIYGYFNNDGGGMSTRYGIQLLHEWGCLPLTEFSATGDNPELHKKLKDYFKANPNYNDYAAKYKIDSYAKVSSFDEVKKAIAAGMPVVGVVKTQGSFGKLNNGIEPKYPKGATGRHAICFVGWKKINNEDYLIAINSWGEGNGDKGKVYIPKGRSITDLFAISDKITPIKCKAKELILNIDKTNYLVDGKEAELDAAPYIKDDRTYVPIRFCAQNLGAAVSWKAEENEATLTSEEAIIKLRTHDKKIIVIINGKEKEYEIDAEPEILNDRMMVPIRFISEYMSCKVEWNAETRQAIIKAR